MFLIGVAETVVEIDNRFCATERACRDYIADGTPAFRIRVSEEETKAARRSLPFLGSDADAECYLLGRQLAALMPDYGAYLLHASVIECHGMVCAFCAPRGVGKSTHTALWQARFGSDVTVLNGDKPLLRPTGNAVVAYGTPWGGKEGLHCNRCAPLSAICFLEQAPENEALPVSRAEEVDKLIKATIAPRSPDALVSLLAETVKKVPAFRLRCNISQNAVDTAYQYLYALL